MDNKILEIFIPGPAGRLEAKYFKSKKNTSPVALVLQPHPQYGGTMNNKVVVETFKTFMENDFFKFVELILEVLVKVMANLIMVKES
jgi:alpha/beta superfamily hydrolase